MVTKSPLQLAERRPPAPMLPLTLETVTDWYIPARDDSEEGVVIYPGAITPAAGSKLAKLARSIREMIAWRESQEQNPAADWQLDHPDGVQLRVHRQATGKGTIYILRRIATDLPDIERLGLPKEIKHLLGREDFGANGGLVLVTGGPGHGKSTTCAALILHRVQSFGSFCLTVEDPPEFPLQDQYPARNGRTGQIIQVPARTESFAYDLKDALRCYPSNVRGSMLMVGEVRDGDAAAHLLRAAVNGQLVLATLHAGDPISALERVLSLAKGCMGDEEARGLLAHSLRAVLHQKLSEGKLVMQALVSLSSNSNVAGNIKSGRLAHLSSELSRQQTLVIRGTLVSDLMVALNTMGA